MRSIAITNIKTINTGYNKSFIQLSVLGGVMNITDEKMIKAIYEICNYYKSDEEKYSIIEYIFENNDFDNYKNYLF